MKPKRFEKGKKWRLVSSVAYNSKKVIAVNIVHFNTIVNLV